MIYFFANESLTEEESFYAEKGLYGIGELSDYQEYRKLSKSSETIGSKKDIKEFKNYLDQKDIDDKFNFNIKCL